MNPYQQQQQFAQPTGMSFAEPIQHRHNPYQNNSQGFNASHLQAQMTGFQQIQTTAFQQPQATGFQQPQMTGFQQPQMTGFQQPQMTGYSSNPFGQSTSSSSFGTSNSQTMQASPSTPSNYSKLNAMLQNRDDGMDTFGNTGNLRIPYGTGFAATGALVSQNNNNSFSQPFAQQPSRNPFGNTTQPQQGQAQQKSMFEMMQQPQQQQMTGFPQMTGMQQQQQQQPQFTGQPSFL
ncbi:uncharacterized protein B0P05DRAFT_292211 [Gilbertella persicaria]|nr:uncharacterized protein B0P05DRAFT_292211 [Gilbertella persicaria]KAI8090895.1 hypothetical protein B0P05DRAFT_292211 [Gilbertella persicaria]